MDGPDQPEQVGPGQYAGENEPHDHRHPELVAHEQDHQGEAEDDYQVS